MLSYFGHFSRIRTKSSWSMPLAQQLRCLLEHLIPYSTAQALLSVPPFYECAPSEAAGEDHVSGSLLPIGRSKLSSRTLASAWPSSGCYRHLGSEAVGGWSPALTHFVCLSSEEAFFSTRLFMYFKTNCREEEKQIFCLLVYSLNGHNSWCLARQSMEPGAFHGYPTRGQRSLEVTYLLLRVAVHVHVFFTPNFVVFLLDLVLSALVQLLTH